MLHRILKIVVLISGLTGQSCSDNFYMPISQNSLKFSQKGDTDFSFGINSVLGTNCNLGYSFVDNIAISGQIVYVPGYKTNEINYFWPEYNTFYSTTIEATYYKKSNAQKYIYPELSIGYSSGKSDDIEKNRSRQFYLQPSISFRKKWFGISFSNKIGSTVFQDKYGSSPHFWLLEPAGTLNFFHKYSKFQIQYAATANRKIVNDYLNYNTFNEVVLVGFSFNQDFIKNILPRKK